MSWNVYSVQYTPHSNNIKSYCGFLHTPISFWHKTMPVAVIKYLDNYCKRWDSFSLTVSHTRQKQNYKNYTSAVYCRNNGKADHAPLLWNTRNIYMRDFVAVLLIFYVLCFSYTLYVTTLNYEMNLCFLFLYLSYITQSFSAKLLKVSCNWKA